jgi:chemotaxis protein MotA
MDGGNLMNLVNVSALVLILGGTIGATMVSSRFEDLLALPRVVAGILRPPAVDLPGLVERIAALALKARRNGLLALEEDVPAAPDPVLARGLQMIVDGAEADALRSVLQTEIMLRQGALARQANLLETAGGFAPTMGIMGTVLGLIHVLGNLANASALGPSIATAFLATFYGISTANVFWLPLANKLRAQAQTQALAHEMVLEGVLSIHAGDNPSTVRDKLNTFLRDAAPAAGRAAKAGRAEAAGERAGDRAQGEVA